MSDPLGPMGLQLVKSDLPLDRLNVNDIVVEVGSRFYRGVYPIEGPSKARRVIAYIYLSFLFWQG
jgi:hypothetical protein